MLKYFTSIVLYFLLTISAYSQSDSLNGDLWDNKILHFRFQGLADLNLKSLNGGVGFSVKLSDESVVRSIVSFYTNNGIYNTNLSPASTHRSQNSLGVNIDYLSFGNMRSAFRPYWGTGFGLYASYFLTSNRFDGLEVAKTKQRDISLRLNLITGIEYFVSKDISVTAEYILTGNITYSEYNQFSNPDVEPRTNIERTYRVNTDTFGLIASFYF